MVLSPLVGFALAFAGDARDHVDLPAAATRTGSTAASGWRRPSRRRAGARPRPAGRPEDDGRDLPGAGHRRATPPPTTEPAAVGRDLARPRAISLGTYSGGWRIMRTLGRRIIHLDPARGFAAESVGASRALHHGVRLPGPDLDHAHHHLGDHGRRRHQALLRRPLGRGPLDRRPPGSSPSPPPAGRRRRWSTCVLPRSSFRLPLSAAGAQRRSRARRLSRSGRRCRPRWPPRRGCVKIFLVGFDLDQLAGLAGALRLKKRGVVGDPGGLLHVVGDDHDRVLGLELVDQVLDRRGRDRVEGRARLVHQQHLRLDRDRAGDAEPLLLAAGEAHAGLARAGP